MHGAVQIGDDLLLMGHELILVDEYGHGIDAGGHVLKGEAQVLENLKDTAAEADLRVHHGFLDGDGAEALLAGDAGDGVAGLAAGIFHNHRSRILGTVGVQNVNRDALHPDREDGIFMQNAGAHVGELPEFPVGDGIDGDRIFHNAGVGDQETGHIRPVFIDIRMHGAGHDGTGDVGTAAGEGVDGAVGKRTVEARNDGSVQTLQPVGQLLIGFFREEGAVFIEEDHLSGVDKFTVKVAGHDDAVQVFSAGGGVVAAGLREEVFFHLCKFEIQVQIQVKTFDDGEISLLNLLECFSVGIAILDGVIALIEQVGHFGVGLGAASRGGRDDIASGLVGADDVADLFKLLCARKRAAAEFYYLFHNVVCLLRLAVNSAILYPENT